ncbi:MAG: SpoIIE family protein phosphatase [Bacteroidota bacterium]
MKTKAEQLLENGEKSEAAGYLNRIATYYWQNNDHQQAIDYFNQSLTVNEEIGNANAILGINNYLALIYADISQYDQSLNYFNKVLAAHRSAGNKVGTATTLVNMTSPLRQSGKFQEAVDKALEAEALAREISNRELLRRCYGILAENYESLGNSEEAFKYFDLYKTFERESQQEELQQNQQQIRALEQQRKQAEEEKEKTAEALDEVKKISTEKQSEIDSLRKEDEIKDMLLKEQDGRLKAEERIVTLTIIGLVIFFALAVVMFFNFRAKKRTSDQLTLKNEELHEVHEEIKGINLQLTSSINYASRIQNAILPTYEQIESHLPHSFVFFRPREVVSGDFYWFSYVEGMQDSFINIKEKVIITAVDCTGHGVPGAFMSMIGSSILNRTVNNRGITSPDKILDELHKGVREELNQDATQNKDGMDMALCVIHPEDRVIEFAGAKNPMIYIQDGELIQIKGDKYPIGGVDRKGKTERKFNKHRVLFDKPTTVYLLSDGFQDQFGGPEGRKYMIKRLKNLFLEIYEKPMKEQQQIIESALEDWMKPNHKQIDDILVIGFKV